MSEEATERELSGKEILFNLVYSNTCLSCTKFKNQRKSFCNNCYGKLPVTLQRDLYKSVPEYFDVFRTALEYLQKL